MTQVAGPHSEHYRVRDEELLVGLRRELLGPAPGAAPEDRDEVLAEDAPIDRYLTGILYPRSVGPNAEQRIREDEAEHDGLDVAPLRTRDSVEESGTAQEVGAAGSRRPSSMGLTFAVDPAISDSIVVSARAAVYEPTDPEGKPIPARRAEARTTSEQRERWRRKELVLPDAPVDVTTPAPDKKFDLGAGPSCASTSDALTQPPVRSRSRSHSSIPTRSASANSRTPSPVPVRSHRPRGRRVHRLRRARRLGFLP